MNAERQLIGSLLMDQSRYENVDYINSEMFSDPFLSSIFSVYEHYGNEEINPLVIKSHVKSEFIDIEELLQELIIEHDASVTDKYCADTVLRNYQARCLDQFWNCKRITPENVEEVMQEAKTFIDGLERKEINSDIQSLSELTALQENYFTPKNEKKIKIGIEEIDKAIGGFDEGDVSIIAARPGVGKSAFALQIIRKFGRDGVKVGYFNLEMAKKQIYERAVATSSGIELNRIRLGTTFHNDEKDNFDFGNRVMGNEKNVYVISGMQTISNIRRIQKKYNFELIVIDYLQLIKPDGKRNGNRIAEVGDISRGIKEIASDFNIPVIALSQLNRVSEQNKDREPSMSELRESGDLEQDASTIIMLWNSNRENRNEKTIKVEKSRNGTCDRVKLYFDGKHMTFSVNDYSVCDNQITLEDIPFDVEDI
jgi:replicative DNA helicase